MADAGTMTVDLEVRGRESVEAATQALRALSEAADRAAESLERLAVALRERGGGA